MNWSLSLNAVGRSIELTKKPNPTKEELLDLQTIYIEKLQELFDEHKSKYARPGCNLVISWRALLPEQENIKWRTTMPSVALLRFSNIRWTLKFPEKSVRFWNFPEKTKLIKIMVFLLLALFVGCRLQRKVKFMLYIYFTCCYIEQI